MSNNCDKKKENVHPFFLSHTNSNDPMQKMDWIFVPSDIILSQFESHPNWKVGDKELDKICGAMRKLDVHWVLVSHFILLHKMNSTPQKHDKPNPLSNKNLYKTRFYLKTKRESPGRRGKTSLYKSAHQENGGAKSSALLISYT